MAKFSRGQSGNPGGRPKGMTAYVQKTCGADGKKLIDILWSIAQNVNEDTKDRIRAASDLLDRGWNKPSQGMYFTDEMRPLVVDLVNQGDVDARREANAE